MTESRTDRSTDPVSLGSWRELLGPRYLGTSIVLAGGVALDATNGFLTISLMPNAIEDIGGHRFYAWVMSVCLVSSVIGATTVGSLVQRLGPRRSYLWALAIFGASSVGCATTPTMEGLLMGRTAQGLAAGILAGLGYTLINTTLPDQLWVRASALISAMWGVGTLVGPAAGGLFAQFNTWRWAFGMLAIVTLLMAVLVPAVLPARTPTAADDAPRLGFPVRSLLLLGAATLAVSAAALPHNPWAMAALLAAGVVAVGVFIVVDNRAHSAVLPPTTFKPGPLKWIYLTLGILMAVTMVDTYVPFFSQRLADVPPLLAGFIGACPAIGWTIAEIVSASLRNDRLITRLVTAAPPVVAISLAVGALAVREHGSNASTAMWIFCLLMAGAGVGIAWPHLSASAMHSVADPAEGPSAAAAINTVQLICAAFGAGLAGVVVNISDGGDVTAARWLFVVFAVMAAVGTLSSYRSQSRARRQQRACDLLCVDTGGEVR